MYCLSIYIETKCIFRDLLPLVNITMWTAKLLENDVINIEVIPYLQRFYYRLQLNLLLAVFSRLMSFNVKVSNFVTLFSFVQFLICVNMLRVCILSVVWWIFIRNS